MSSIQEAALTWTSIGWHAARLGEAPSIICGDQVTGWQCLSDRINRCAHLLADTGLTPGDGVAMMLPNGPDFVVVLMAALQSGLRVTPVNWHLGTEEAAYIVADCEAKVFVADAQFSVTAQKAARSAHINLGLSSNGPIPGFIVFDDALAAHPATPIVSPQPGNAMLYTSGTTGSPKGVYRKHPDGIDYDGVMAVTGYRNGDVTLCCGPAYHGAPLVFDIVWPLTCGIPIIMMERFDAKEALEAIQTHGVTHAHMVPTMFSRLLALPEAVRMDYDVSSLRRVIHGAAPCPEHVKRAMIDWFGPILQEYYAASEGSVGLEISSEEWLDKPGSVGRPMPANAIRVLDEDGRDAPANTAGQIYMAASDNPFVYFKAEEKTEAAYRDGYFTLGDVGYLDQDGYLFLTGRSAECIISGGVNIYPQEIDNVLLAHPAVLDVCTIGIPDEEWGEAVCAVIIPADGFLPEPELAQDIMTYARVHLSGFKCPRRIDFTEDLPRVPSGKVIRSRVRAPYWDGRDKAM